MFMAPVHELERGQKSPQMIQRWYIQQLRHQNEVENTTTGNKTNTSSTLQEQLGQAGKLKLELYFIITILQKE